MKREKLEEIVKYQKALLEEQEERIRCQERLIRIYKKKIDKSLELLEQLKYQFGIDSVAIDVLKGDNDK